MFCQKCGSEMSDDAAFCGRCGAKVASPHAAAHSNTASAAAAVKPEAAKPEMRPTEMRKSLGQGGWLWRLAFIVPILGIGYSVMRDGLPEPRATSSSEAVARSEGVALDKSSAPLVDQSPKILFDLSVSEAERLEAARKFFVGNYSRRYVIIGPTVENLTFAEDGTFTRSYCHKYGEVSERKFTTSSGRWRVQEMRYLNTGMVYYAAALDGEWNAVLTLDRDDGIQVRSVDGEVDVNQSREHITSCE